ncbi:MAG: class I SAM-dependent methyltransferase [Elusimicrobia bacterium]|nr:class I SAM-dependent methyltransferase [Elusimicrobiota bacterium]
MRGLTRRVLRAAGRRLSALSERLADDRPGEAHRRAVLSANAGHDMAADPDEAHYARQYLSLITPALETLSAGKSAKILDLGCGHGRLTIPCAEFASAGRVVAVDFSASALASLAAGAKAKGLGNVGLCEADAATFAAGLPPGSFDAALCCEVLYNVPEWRAVLSSLSKALKPGGVLVVSLRSRWFELTRAAAARDMKSARTARDAREGRFGDGDAWSCWHTPEEAAAAVTAAGLSVERVAGIGVLSGLPDDPFGRLLSPSRLVGDERCGLFELETSLASEYAGQGRYIAVVARRNP